MVSMLILQRTFSVLMFFICLMLLTIRIHELKKFFNERNHSDKKSAMQLVIKLIAGIVIVALSIVAIIFMAMYKSIDSLMVVYVIIPAILAVNYIFYIDARKMKGLYVSFKGLYCTGLVITSLYQYSKGITDIYALGFWFAVTFAVFDMPLVKEGYDMLFDSDKD